MGMAIKVTKLPNTRSRADWAALISCAWREQLPSIFETGNLLEAAKAELLHGEWELMFKNNEAPFSKRMGNMLIKIADDERLRNGKHASHLPVHWSILHELTKLTAAQFENGIASGAINPNMQRKDVRKLRGIEPKSVKKKAAASAAPQSESKNLVEWIRTIGPQIEFAYRELPEEDKGALLAGLMQTFAILEPSYAE
jgi:hypothetical protein